MRGLIGGAETKYYNSIDEETIRENYVQKMCDSRVKLLESIQFE
jgi:hypothetical protein